MKTSEELKKELAEKEARSATLQKEYDEHISVFETELAKIDEKLNEADAKFAPKIKECEDEIAKINAKFLPFGKEKKREPYKAKIEELNNEKEKEKSKFREQKDKILGSDPRIKEIEAEQKNLRSEIFRLKTDVEQAEFNEMLGVNNLIVRVQRGFTAGEAREASIVVDGANKGGFTKPASIIPLSAGAHSVSLKLAAYLSSYVNTFETKDVQFGLRDNNKYLLCKAGFKGFTNPVFNADVKVFDNVDDFIYQSDISKYELESYIKSIMG